MKRDKIKKMVGIMLAAAMFVTMPHTVNAEDASASTQEGIIEDDGVVIEDDDKPYLALGADLTAEQQKKVLDLMGISAADLDQYDVTYVNNNEEHEYLDSYISSSAIGKKSLSSVVIVQAEAGSGVNISTYNINYCTAGMYKNAVATAGITDANIIVAAPFSISGTAALVGVFKAYSEMTGDKLDEDAVDAAMDELVTTGSIVEDVDGPSTDVEAMIAELKEKVAKGELDTKEEIEDAIRETASDYKLQLSEENVEDLTNLLTKLKDLDIDWDSVISQASDWAKKLDDQFGDQIRDAVTSEGFWDKIASFFQKIIDAIKSLFS